jgi:hypothetical protein
VGIVDTTEYKFHGLVKDFYLNGDLQMSGTFYSNIKSGTFKFYYPGNKLKTEGKYVDDRKYGIWTNFYENGQVKERLLFNGGFISVLEYNDENGQPLIIDGTGCWMREFLNEFSNNYVKITGCVRDSLSDGIWNYYEKKAGLDADYELKCTEKYSKGRFIDGILYTGRSYKYNLKEPYYDVSPDPEKFEKMNWTYVTDLVTRKDYPFLKFLPEFDSTLMAIDAMAIFPGGIDSLCKVFMHNFLLIKKYNRRNDYHFTRIEMLVDENGHMTVVNEKNPIVNIINNIDPSYSNDVMKLLADFENWKPAMRAGKKVTNRFYLEIIQKEGLMKFTLISRNPPNNIPENGPIPIPDNKSNVETRTLPVINL